MLFVSEYESIKSRWCDSEIRIRTLLEKFVKFFLIFDVCIFSHQN